MTPTKTPAKVARIAKDESFKTCKTTMPTPRTRRQLRMTPLRTSIMSGEKPFKETPNSGKKFNMRTRKNRTPLNETGGSNETFIRCEQELLFETDSLEVMSNSRSPSKVANLTSSPKVKATGTPIPLPYVNTRRCSTPKPQLRSKPQITPVEMPQQQPEPREQPAPPKIPQSKPSPKLVAKQITKQPVPKPKIRSPFKKPANIQYTRYMPSSAKSTAPRIPGTKDTMARSRASSVMSVSSRYQSSGNVSTASKYLSNLNGSRLTRASSFKSTAELERDYFSSLRKF